MNRYVLVKYPPCSVLEKGHHSWEYTLSESGREMLDKLVTGIEDYITFNGTSCEMGKIIWACDGGEKGYIALDYLKKGDMTLNPPYPAIPVRISQRAVPIVIFCSDSTIRYTLNQPKLHSEPGSISIIDFYPHASRAAVVHSVGETPF